MAKSKRDERIQVFVTEREKEQIERAAEADHRSVASFIRSRVLPDARKQVTDEEAAEVSA